MSQEKNFLIPWTKSRALKRFGLGKERPSKLDSADPSWEPSPWILVPREPKEPAIPFSCPKAPLTWSEIDEILVRIVDAPSTTDPAVANKLDPSETAPPNKAFIGVRIELNVPETVPRTEFKIPSIKFWAAHEGVVIFESKSLSRILQINLPKPPIIFLKTHDKVSVPLLTLSYNFGISLGNKLPAIFFTLSSNLLKLNALTPCRMLLIYPARSLHAALIAFWINPWKSTLPNKADASLNFFFNFWIVINKFEIVFWTPFIGELFFLEVSNKGTSCKESSFWFIEQ